MMKRAMIAGLAGMVAVSWLSVAHAEDRASKAEALDMLKRATEFVRTDGVEKSYVAFADKNDPRFHDRDLYVTVYDLTGTCLSHGVSSKMIGQNFADNQDVDGKFYVRERLEKAKTSTSFSHEYKWTSPVTKKVETKTMFCEVLNNTTVCVGAYN